MTLALTSPGRRRVLVGAAACGRTCHAGPARKSCPRSVLVAQIVDTSPTQQDVSKDFLIGSRAAWQDINLKGGLRGRPVQHVSCRGGRQCRQHEGRCNSCWTTRPAWCCRAPPATRLPACWQPSCASKPAAIAHVAPWLQNSSVEVDERTFPIFAARQEQIGHALRR
jgi:hypothetical protein